MPIKALIWGFLIGFGGWIFLIIYSLKYWIEISLDKIELIY